MVAQRAPQTNRFRLQTGNSLARLFLWVGLAGLVSFTPLTPLAAQSTAEAPAAAAEEADPAAAIEKAIDQDIEIELKSGTVMPASKLLAVIRDPKTSRIRALSVQRGSTPKKVVSITGVKQVKLAGDVIYELQLAERDTKKSTGRLTKEEREQQELARQAEVRAQWLARLEARGVKPWPELTDAEHQATIDQHKKLVEESGKNFPGMQLVETKNFMVFTNIPPVQMAPYVASLDSMHDMMCVMYRLPKDARVFRGKALIVAFLEKTQFAAFEQQYFQHEAGDAYGLCHSFGDGRVVVTCYRGDNYKEFGRLLVHETSHGFIHRYKTAVRLPSWVNEGMADYIAEIIVPGGAGRKEDATTDRLKQTRSLGGNFFTLTQNIEFWQYGSAVGMTRFLIRSNKDAYVQLIEDLKEGMPWEEALNKNYNATPAQLAAAYGLTIGIPDLKP